MSDKGTEGRTLREKVSPSLLLLLLLFFLPPSSLPPSDSTTGLMLVLRTLSTCFRHTDGRSALGRRPGDEAAQVGAARDGRCRWEAGKGTARLGEHGESPVRCGSGLGCDQLWGPWDNLAPALQPQLRLLGPHRSPARAASHGVGHPPTQRPPAAAKYQPALDARVRLGAERMEPDPFAVYSLCV